MPETQHSLKKRTKMEENFANCLRKYEDATKTENKDDIDKASKDLKAQIAFLSQNTIDKDGNRLVRVRTSEQSSGGSSRRVVSIEFDGGIKWTLPDSLAVYSFRPLD